MKDMEITVNGRKLLTERGVLLSDVIGIEKPCGGHGSCGKCKVIVDGSEELACRYVVTSPIKVEFKEKENIESVTGVGESGRRTERMCLVLDIGTTTLALALVSLDDKRAVRVITATNPQRAFGADVITRIEYCSKNSVDALKAPLVSEINRMIAEIGAEGIGTMYVSANTTMLHTFFGVDCSSIGVAPYTPVFLEGRREQAESLGLRGVREAISLPSVSSFVGADIVAGLNCVEMPEKGKYSLLVDLGTNAEVVLYSSESALATAAAAGPCFEGANIKCGMSATPGAIYAFEIKNGRADYKTIADEKASGICGTGLIDIISGLLESGDIDDTGYMEEDYALAEGVYLSCEDVRQYQLAKSAVYSAILSLMRTEGVSADDISKMYVSGGFSAHINLSNAVKSGLLPAELEDRAEFLNNSSLLGTIKYACGDSNVDQFVRNTRYVDLSSNAYFTDLFIRNMMFEV